MMAVSPVEHMVTQGQATEATEALLNIEKTQRLAEDVGGTRRAVTAVLEVLHGARDWKGLNDHILLLTKRRSQLKQVKSVGIFTQLRSRSALLRFGH